MPVNDIVGQVINNRYRIISLLGEGGMGITYEAEDLNTQSKVALKTISLKQVNDWKQIELIEREAEVLKKLNHPGIPQYLDYFTVDTKSAHHKYTSGGSEADTQADRYFYIIQELVSGKSLDKWVKEGWRVSEKELKNIAQQILDILIYLHQQKPPIIHRDIKPQNLIRNETGKIFLVDFGAVQNTYYSTIAKGSTIVGTYGYIPLEQSSGNVTPASDLYSLGATLLYLLTHRSPSELDDDNFKINVGKCVNNNQISQGLINWLSKMLEPDLDDRFDSSQTALLVLNKPHLIKEEKKNINTLLQGWMTMLTIGVAGFLFVNSLVSFKWFFLSRLGYYPQPICPSSENEDATNLLNYLEGGGKFSTIGKVTRNNPLCLITAVKNGDLKLTKLLIEYNADINAKNRDDETLLLQTKNVEMAKLLIENGADVNARNRDDETPLHRTKEIEMAKLLIGNGADVNARNRDNETPLHRTKDIKIAKLLIENDADVNAKTKDGDTPLHEVVDVEIAKLLIENGADVNAQNNYGKTPLGEAENLEINKLLISHGAKYSSSDTPLIGVTNIEMAKQFISHGADVNAKAYYGKTALHHSTGRKDIDVEIAKLLIDNGADVNAKMKNNETPLHRVIHIEVAKLLVSHGANVNAKTENGDTPLHWVRNKEIAKLLIEHGADVNAKTLYGDTPISKAYSLQIKQVIRQYGGK